MTSIQEQIFDTIQLTSSAIQAIKDLQSIISTNKYDTQYLQDIRLINDKLDEMQRLAENVIVGKLKAANLQLVDYASSNALNETNIQTIRELYTSNIGLPLDEQTGSYNNNDIIAYSYYGLIQLEMLSTKNKTLISRYIVRMFEANSNIAKESFPEVYSQCYGRIIAEYEYVEREMLFNNTSPYINFNDLNEISELICFYDLGINIDTWVLEDGNIAEKMKGKLLNKIIGPVSISPYNCSKIFLMFSSVVKNDGGLATTLFKILTRFVCQFIMGKYSLKQYEEKRRTMLFRTLSKIYLEHITLEVE